MTESERMRLVNLDAEIERVLASPSKLEDRLLFQLILNAAMAFLDLGDDDVAGKLPVSRSSVTRWRTGTDAPLPMMRKPVYKLLRRKIQEALKP